MDDIENIIKPDLIKNVIKLQSAFMTEENNNIFRISNIKFRSNISKPIILLSNTTALDKYSNPSPLLKNADSMYQITL